MATRISSRRPSRSPAGHGHQVWNPSTSTDREVIFISPTQSSMHQGRLNRLFLCENVLLLFIPFIYMKNILWHSFFYRSELYSPTKSDIYGSKSEFMFGHNTTTTTPTSNRNSYFGGHSTRPSSIYSPVGTLTRRGSKATPMGGHISGVNGERGVEESGNFYESDSGVSSLYEPLSFNGGNGGSSLQLMNPHSTSQHRYVYWNSFISILSSGAASALCKKISVLSYCKRLIAMGFFVRWWVNIY